MHPSELYRPRHFRLAPAYRRCAVYLLVGMVLVVCLLRLVGVFVRRQPGFHGEASGGFVVGAFFVVLLVTPAIFILRWKIRVDERGIARRWLWGWNVWPWEAFQDGRIRQGLTSYAYRWPEKPWWNRALSFAFLREADAEFLAELCRSVWVPPPAPEVPAELTIRYGVGTTVRFAPEGIRLGASGKERDYGWSDVAQLRLIRWEHDRRDFLRLELELPDRTIKLFFHKGRPNWRDAEAEPLAALVAGHVPAERTLIAAKRGAPRSLPEADYRLQELDKRRRQIRSGSRALVVLTLGLLLFAALGALGLTEDARKDTAIGVTYALLLAPCFWVFRDRKRQLRAEQEKLEHWRAELAVEEKSQTA